MTELHRSAADAAARSVRDSGQSPSQWTDNVARVYAVIKRHPEITFSPSRVTAHREFEASWPTDPADPDSEIRSVQTPELYRLADALEKQFPE